MKDFETYFKAKQKCINAEINRLLIKKSIPKRLKLAMNYSLKARGKRLRPVLILMMDDIFRRQFDNTHHSTDIFNLALSLECIHTYSLIHDDLPCMDDDNLRRGKPTCHIQFDEATAILAGDALLTLAFELVGSIQTEKGIMAKLITLLANAAGGAGMVGGQILDMQNEKNICPKPIKSQIKKIHALKTGALIQASILLPALLKKAKPAEYLAFENYSKCIGVGFQIVDDILDVTGTSEDLGKPANSDAGNNKNTYVSLIGLNQAQKDVVKIIDKSKAILKKVSRDTRYLADLSDYILNRKK